MTTLGPPPAVTPAASPAGFRKPSTAGYWIATVIALAGLFGAIVWAASGALDSVARTGNMARAALPASVTTEVDEPRTLVVYYEGARVPSLTQLDVQVSGPGGTPVPVDDLGYDVRYDSPAQPGVVGTGIAAFEAAEPGRYTTTTSYDPGGLAYLAVGENIGADFLQRTVGPLLLAAGAFLLALVIAIRTAVRRARR
jgi:hypothetical protein